MQNTKFNPSRLKGSEIKREIQFLQTSFVFWGSNSWQRSGRNVTQTDGRTASGEPRAAGTAAPLQFCSQRMLALRKILSALLLYCPSEITVGCLTRGFSDVIFKQEVNMREEKPPKSLSYPSFMPRLFLNVLLLPTVPAAPPRILRGVSLSSSSGRKAALFSIFPC